MNAVARIAPSQETAAMLDSLTARTPVLEDLPTTDTFCVVATQTGSHNRGRFIYACAQTQHGAAMMADGLRKRGTSNKRGYLRPCVNVRVVQLHTPAFRAADYMMTEAERQLALAV